MRTRAIVTATTLVASVALASPATAREAAGPAPVTPALAVDRATSAVAKQAALFAASPADTFSDRGVIIEKNGASHVRLNRAYRGLPVISGDVIAHLTPTGALNAVTSTQTRPLTLSAAPALTAAKATSAAAKALGGKNAGVTATLAVDARAATPVLVWRTVVTVTDPAGGDGVTHVLVNAQTGTVVDKWAEVQTVEGSGSGYSVGTVTLDTTKSGSTYQLKDPVRGGNYTTDMNNRRIGKGTLFTDADNVWGTGELTNDQTVAVDAQYGVAETWDYYLEKFGRSGIAGDGVGSYNKVHYGSRYNNAGWSDSCFCMLYGDGDGVTYGPFTALDVAGHEMTHGVTSRTAGLVYSGESGGINESMSDVFGSLVEFHSANAEDTGDYLIGENIAFDHEPLRYMDDPGKDGKSAACWSTAVKNLDVHYSSGVGNHAFFLLAVGSGASTVNGVTYNSPTCNSSTVTGIGNDKAGAIFYKALTTYMTSGTNYAAARTATLNAARDLYGAGSTEYATTAAAWSAVNVA
ncbi:M4 family metallopeptidase [Actinoplanes friuliensis]|uniref:Neutral metalloproteinase n=1 Tax=Actinoplanes friuliensis DSM 7358 TaxID=1246995 RepID=U5VZ98_9ACTN|nr:M4 family metallopeptidase [Actinoplanes friuliensis]AGZ42199.1 neutral zinc metalloprotease [Actinoplanes friuliensis DSM 7358]